MQERKCKFCGDVEDEPHVLLDCFQYKNIRDTLFEIVLNTEDNFSTINSKQEQFSIIMSSANPKLIKALGNFLGKVHKIHYHNIV